MGDWTKAELVVHPLNAYLVPRGHETDDPDDCQPVCAMLWPTDIRSEEETLGNAERLAACWNAHLNDPDPSATMKEVVEVLAAAKHTTETAARGVAISTESAGQRLLRIDALLSKLSGGV